MFILSLILFAAALLVLAVAASRGLRDIDDILEVVDTDAAPPRAPHGA